MRASPIVMLARCSLEEANALLVAWEHKMGALDRGDENYGASGYFALLHDDAPVAVCTHSGLIRDHAGGGLAHLTRDNTIELSRLCAARAGLCRVMLRLWREFVFPSLGRQFALSYQDADKHSGNTYRFDGWKRSPSMSRSGTDQRTGRRGRNKWLWLWELPADHPGAANRPKTYTPRTHNERPAHKVCTPVAEVLL